MALTAGGSTVVDSAPAFISDAGMRTRIRRIPILCCMTLSTIGAEHTGMKGWVTVAVHTSRRKPSEHTGSMAFFASHIDVTTRQREVTLLMIEGDIFPIGRFMTCATVSAKFAIMFIVLFVAGVAVAGCTFVDTVLMALLTFRFNVFAFEFEGSQVVIELCRRPGFSGMAVGAVQAETSLVWLILAMAGETIF